MPFHTDLNQNLWIGPEMQFIWVYHPGSILGQSCFNCFHLIKCTFSTDVIWVRLTPAITQLTHSSHLPTQSSIKPLIRSQYVELREVVCRWHSRSIRTHWARVCERVLSSVCFYRLRVRWVCMCTSRCASCWVYLYWLYEVLITVLEWYHVTSFHSSFTASVAFRYALMV